MGLNSCAVMAAMKYRMTLRSTEYNGQVDRSKIAGETVLYSTHTAFDQDRRLGVSAQWHNPVTCSVLHTHLDGVSVIHSQPWPG